MFFTHLVSFKFLAGASESGVIVVAARNPIDRKIFIGRKLGL